MQEKHLTLLSELAKTLGIEISETLEDDTYYLDAMDEGVKSGLLNEEQKLDFISSIKIK